MVQDEPFTRGAIRILWKACNELFVVTGIIPVHSGDSILFAQEGQGQAAILVTEEARLAVVAALGHVVGNLRQGKAGGA